MRHLVVALLLASSVAHGDSFGAGKKAYELGDFATAIEAFAQAYAQDPSPEVAFSYAQALRRAYYVDLDPQLLVRARTLYAAYLDAAPGGPRARHARQHLATIDRLLDRLVAQTPERPKTQLLIYSEVADARARIDGGPELAVPVAVETTPGPHRVHVEAVGHDAVDLDVLALDGKTVVATGTPAPRPGRVRVRAPEGATVALDGVRLAGDVTPIGAGAHVVSVRRAGFVPLLRDVQVPVDGEVTVDAALAPTPRRRAARVLLWTGAGLGAASAVASLVALHEQSLALDARPADGASDPAAYNRAREARDVWRGAAIGAGAAALACAGVGLYLLLADDAPLETRPPAPRVVPVVGPDTLGLAGSF